MNRLFPTDRGSSRPADDAIPASDIRARETALRAAFLAPPDAAQRTASPRVAVTQARSRVFDPDLLPDRIRDDPRYWRDRVVRVVTCPPDPVRVPRPGWPIRRLAAAAASH